MKLVNLIVPDVGPLAGCLTVNADLYSITEKQHEERTFRMSHRKYKIPVSCIGTVAQYDQT